MQGSALRSYTSSHFSTFLHFATVFFSTVSPLPTIICRLFLSDSVLNDAEKSIYRLFTLYPRPCARSDSTSSVHQWELEHDLHASATTTTTLVASKAGRQQLESGVHRAQQKVDGPKNLPKQGRRFSAQPYGRIGLWGDDKLTVNRASQDEQYPLPNVEDMFAPLTGRKTFTKLDLRHAYAQVPLDDKSKEYTTINTPLGLFRYNRMPFEVSSAPSCFQHIIDGKLQGKLHTARLDDIFLTGKNDDGHLANLTAVLSRLRTASLKLKRIKCSFMQPSIMYMGFVVDAEGVCTQSSTYPAKQERAAIFLGSPELLQEAFPNLSTMAEPLNRLLRDNTPLDWTDAQQGAFDSTKANVCSSDVLNRYDRSKPLCLACDALPHGVGAVL